MTKLKDIVTNIITEAVQSVKTEGRTPTATNLSMKAGPGTNVDQLWLRCQRGLAKLKKERDELEQQIENFFVELQNSPESDNKEYYINQREHFMNSPLMVRYNTVMGMIDKAEKALEMYEADHAIYDGIASPEARQQLKTACDEILLLYDTKTFDSAMNKLRQKFMAAGFDGSEYDD